MAKNELKKTYSTWSNNPSVNRANHIRRDNDTIKTPKHLILLIYGYFKLLTCLGEKVEGFF